MIEEGAQLVHERARPTGHDKLQVRAERHQQPLGVDDVGQHDHHQDEQRHEGEQRVVGDGPREEQSLVGAKGLEHAQAEGDRMLEDLSGVGSQAHDRVRLFERAAP